MDCMGLWDASEAVSAAVKGSVRETDVRDGQGPVVSTVGETFYVSYVELQEDEASALVAAVIREEEHDDPFEAGKAFQRLSALAPERRKEGAPEDPLERLAWEEDVEAARTSIIRSQIALENDPELAFEEIFERGLDRPPEDRT